MTKTFTEALHKGWNQTFTFEGDYLVDERSDFQHIQMFDSAPYGRVMVLDGIVQITERDECTYSEMLAHVPILESGTVRNVMIVGGGDGAIAEEVLKHKSVARVDLVDIDGRVIDLCKQHFTAVHKGAFDDPRLNVFAEDAFPFLDSDAAKGQYDLIIADRPDPVGPAEVLFETRFYTLVREALSEGGIAVFQTGCPMLQPEELSKTVGQLGEVFAHAGTYLVAVPTYVGGFMALTYATKGAVLGDAGQSSAVAARYSEAGISTDYYSPSVHFAAFALPPFIERLVK